MIHDAIVPVTCDGKDCLSMMPVVICGGESEPTDIEWEISNDKGWIIIDGKHYCSEECAREAIGLEFLHGMCDVSPKTS